MAAIFDSIIDKGKESNPNIEYVIVSDIPAFKSSNFTSHQNKMIKAGTIVVNVVNTRNRESWHTGYDYTIKGTNDRYHTNYAWAFAEHTEENMKYLNMLWKQREFIKEQEKIRDEIYSKIPTLEL